MNGAARSSTRRLARSIPALEQLATPLWDRYQHGAMGPYLNRARRIPGWLGMAESIAVARAVLALPPDPTVLEVGSFLGRSTVVIGGALTVRGDGVVHAIDPFDGLGDDFSATVYEEIRATSGQSLRRRFDDNVAGAGVTERVRVHVGTAETVAPEWTEPIDLLFLDGDQSVAGAHRAFALMSPFLRPGGVVALHNSKDRDYAPDHDGNRQVVLRDLPLGGWSPVFTVETTTFARRTS
jgi:predicted O-methyltransferase YrrM